MEGYGDAEVRSEQAGESPERGSQNNGDGEKLEDQPLADARGSETGSRVCGHLAPNSFFSALLGGLGEADCRLGGIGAFGFLGKAEHVDQPDDFVGGLPNEPLVYGVTGRDVKHAGGLALGFHGL